MNRLLASGWWYRPGSLLDNAEFVYSALRIAPVIACVALVAFVFRSRLLFVLGTAGCFAGLLFDRGGSTAGYLEQSMVRAESFLSFGIFGASLGTAIALLIVVRRRQATRVETSGGDIEVGQGLRRNHA